MPRLQEFVRTNPGEPDSLLYVFWCPGCGRHHLFDVGRTKRPVWTFNGDLESPTFSPSLHYPDRCHLFLEAGLIRFLGDCRHALAGQTVPLPEIPPEDVWPNARREH